jgi:hypothetical protein
MLVLISEFQKMRLGGSRPQPEQSFKAADTL